MTRGWSRAVVDVGITYEEDVDRALAVVRDEAAQFSTDKMWGAQLDGPLEVPGIESLGDSAVVIRTLIRTQPGIAVDRGARIPPPAQEAAAIGRASRSRTPSGGSTFRSRAAPAPPEVVPPAARPADESRPLQHPHPPDRPAHPARPGQGVAVHLRPHHLQLRPHRELQDLPLRGPATPLARGQRVRGLPYHEPDRRGRPHDRRGREAAGSRSGRTSIRSPGRSRRTGTGSGSCRRTPSRGRPNSSPP